MIKFICSLLWNSNIPLGRLTPYVLGGMIGRWPHKVDNMLTSSSGGKPLSTRGHINENKELETRSKVPHEGES